MFKRFIAIIAIIFAFAAPIGLAPQPAAAGTYRATGYTNSNNLCSVSGYTSATTALNACVYYMDSHDSCWSGWIITFQSSGQYWLKSRTKVSSWNCGHNTTPVEIRVNVTFG